MKMDLAIGICHERYSSCKRSTLYVQDLSWERGLHIEVDVTDLKLGDSLQVADINLDEKYKLMSSPEAVVASVTHAMREEEPAATEEDVDVFMDDGAPADASEESSDDANSGDASEGE